MLKCLRFLLLLSSLILGLAACRYRPVQPLFEIPKEEPASPGPTPAVCTSWPKDMKVRVAPKTDTSITLELEGFHSGETLIFLFTEEIPGKHSARLEGRPTTTVEANGRFTEVIGLHGIPQINHWQGKVIHARGVWPASNLCCLSLHQLNSPLQPHRSHCQRYSSDGRRADRARHAKMAV